jgi:hypothetical protein
MAFADAFSLFGHRAFSSKPTHGRSIYESMLDSQGDAYNKDFNGLQQARLYAQAICLASAQYALDRAGNNRNPATATELLAKLEDDFQVVPPPTATLPQRRAFLSALVRISHGNSQSAIEGALSLLLGSDFFSYTHSAAAPWPPSPGTVGVFAAAGSEIKQFTITPAISITGTPITVGYTLNSESNAPMAGETYCVDPDPRRATEQIAILATHTGTITATFTRAHEPGTLATRPYPLWISKRRHSSITTTVAAATDPEKRRMINELMAKAARGVSTWQIVHNAGVCTSDDPILGLSDCTAVS